MIAAIFGFFLNIFGSDLVKKAIDAFTKSDDVRIQDKQIDADVIKDAMKYYVESQRMESAKWTIPWFWLAAAPFLASVGGFFLLLTLYNWLWHADGMFPQTWSIAAYPGIYQEWATTVFNFIFAPALGAATIKHIFGRK